MLSRALNNPNIPNKKRMFAKDFFDNTNKDTFGPPKPKTLISKDYSKKSKSRGSTPEGVSNSSSDECKLKASIHWTKAFVLDEEEEKIRENDMQNYLEDFFQC